MLNLRCRQSDIAVIIDHWCQWHRRQSYHHGGNFATLIHAAAWIRVAANFLLVLPQLGCALTFASEAKFEFEAKISFRLEAKKKPDFTWFTSMWNTKNLKLKTKVKYAKIKQKNPSVTN